MKNPFDNIKSLEPFFTDYVEIFRPSSDLRCTLRCNLIDDGFDEVISNSGNTTTVRKVCVSIKRYSQLRDLCNEDDFWPFTDTQPQIGDIISLHNGKKYSVYDIDTFDASIWTLKAKSNGK